MPRTIVLPYHSVSFIAKCRPEELDEAVRRRFTKRLYIPLPDRAARRAIIVSLLAPHRHSLTDADIDDIARLTEGASGRASSQTTLVGFHILRCGPLAGYSGADMRSLAAEASYGPLRDISSDFATADADEVSINVVLLFYCVTLLML